MVITHIPQILQTSLRHIFGCVCDESVWRDSNQSAPLLLPLGDRRRALTGLLPEKSLTAQGSPPNPYPYKGGTNEEVDCNTSMLVRDAARSAALCSPVATEAYATVSHR